MSWTISTSMATLVLGTERSGRCLLYISGSIGGPADEPNDRMQRSPRLKPSGLSVARAAAHGRPARQGRGAGPALATRAGNWPLAGEVMIEARFSPLMSISWVPGSFQALVVAAVEAGDAVGAAVGVLQVLDRRLRRGRLIGRASPGSAGGLFEGESLLSLVSTFARCPYFGFAG